MKGQGRIYSRSQSPFWWVGFYHRGKEQREIARHVRTGVKLEATVDNRREAERYLKRRIGEVIAEQHGGPVFVASAQQRLTVDDLLDSLAADYKLRGKETPQFKAHLKPVREHFGNWRALSIKAESVDNFISALLDKGKAPATVNRSTQLLAQAFNLAIERRHLSTAPHIRHLSERGNARQGFFADREFRAVVDNLPDYLKDFSRFGYLTGWRRGEIASLRWEDVDGDLIRLRGENAKNGEARSITAEGELAELMERRKKARDVKTKTEVIVAGLVFHHKGDPIVDFRKAWSSACVANGLGTFYCRDCRDAEGKCVSVLDATKKCLNCGNKWETPLYVGKLFHDFRRTAVRNMVRAGVPERVAMTISGHKTRSIFDRYNIVSERDLREAMQRTQDYLTVTGAEEAKRKPDEIRRAN